MTITRAQAEAELIARVGKKMAVVGLDGATHDGTNEDLNGPLAVACRAVGVTPASPFTASDSDLSGIPADRLDEFMDRAELRLWENVAGNIDKVDLSLGPRNDALGQLATQSEKAIERLEKKITARYVTEEETTTTLEGGVILLDFQAEIEE